MKDLDDFADLVLLLLLLLLLVAVVVVKERKENDDDGTGGGGRNRNRCIGKSVGDTDDMNLFRTALLLPVVL